MAPNSGERRAARLATASALIVVAGFVAGKAARDAILLSSFPIHTLPIFVGISAIISFPIILVAGKLMTRFGPARLMPTLNAVSAVMAIVEWSLLGRYPRAATIAVFFHLSTSGAVLVSGFWSIVNERFDVQSAKRHIGRIGMGATLGGIAGGVLAERTAVYMSHDKILLVLAALQLISAGTLYLFGRGVERAPVVETSSEGTWGALRVVAKSALLRNVGLVVIFAAIAAGILDYVFKADIVRTSSKGDLLRMLAVFYTTTNIITAAVQVAVCGPLVARLGVPRSVATLPVAVTMFGSLALAVPGALAALAARGAETVTRNSVFRAGYELLYAPLAEEHKRPTKVVLDVGADRVGDLIGAQIVGVLDYFLFAPRVGLLIATVGISALGVMVAMRLRRSYTAALEESLMTRAGEAGLVASAGEAGQAATTATDPPAPEPWITLSGLPRFGQPGDAMLLARRKRERRRPAIPPAAPLATPGTDDVLATVADLRSQDPARIQRALAAGLRPELAAHAIELVGRDDVAREALIALNAVAARCTGVLVDALLDQTREVVLRRRLPSVLLAGEVSLAAWGLWRGLLDPSFDVRYRCGLVLARLAADGHLGGVTTDQVFETVRRECTVDREVWKQQKLIDDLVVAGEDGDDDANGLRGTGLDHVFTVLGLVLPAEPLRIALRAVQTDDAGLRGTALEYLESILPADVRAQLWPFLEQDDAAAAIAPDVASPPKKRTRDEILAELHRVYPAVVERLRLRPKAS